MPTLVSQQPIEHFIRSRLFWFGRISRQDVVSVFDVGTAYVSRLLSKIRTEMPLQESGKAWTLPVTEHDLPEGVSSQRFLSDLYSCALDGKDPTEICGDGIPSVSIDAFRSHVPENILRPIVRALNQRGLLEIEYVGMNIGDEVKKRLIEPLKLVHVGGRWHLNAHCSMANDSRDFVLSRILSVRQMERTPATSPANPLLDLISVSSIVRHYMAHPALSEQQKEVVWREFGMNDDGVLEIALSKSEIFYFEQQYVALSEDEKPPFKLLARCE